MTDLEGLFTVSEIDRILYGDGKSNVKGLLSIPEPAKLPEQLTRQLERQRVRLAHKGRYL